MKALSFCGMMGSCSDDEPSGTGNGGNDSGVSKLL